MSADTATLAREVQRELADHHHTLSGIVRRLGELRRDLERTPEHAQAARVARRAGESGLGTLDPVSVFVWDLAGDLEVDVLGEEKLSEALAGLKRATRRTPAGSVREARVST